MTTHERMAEPLELAPQRTSERRPALSRDLLALGMLDALAAADDPAVRLVSESERLASLRDTLACRPRGDLWVFGYGSLVWNPAMQAVEQRICRVEGWHRAFCLSITALRATADQPGLMLSLDRGGACCGVAYRIAEAAIERELKLLWRREMLLPGYLPRWMDLVGAMGERIGSAIAFTTEAAQPQHAGRLGEAQIAGRLAMATGSLGSGADYLDRTAEGLLAAGIADPGLRRLQDLVREAQRARETSACPEW